MDGIWDNPSPNGAIEKKETSRWYNMKVVKTLMLTFLFIAMVSNFCYLFQILLLLIKCLITSRVKMGT